jgi:hypothetical protein
VAYWIKTQYAPVNGWGEATSAAAAPTRRLQVGKIEEFPDLREAENPLKTMV